MKLKTVAICIIGSELVRGIIADAHGKTISSDLTRLGYEVKEIVIVPDDEHIPAILSQLASQADLIITTGGLGPTSDDITRDAVAQVYQAPLRIDEEAKAVLASRVGSRLQGANLRQVMIPEGFDVVENPMGTAPGFSLPGRFYAMPGPPKEMLTMWNDRVLPDLIRLQDRKVDFMRLEASVFLIPESALEEACSRAVEMVVGDSGVRPIWGTRVQLLRISLYLQGSSEEIRMAVFEQIRELLGPELVVLGDVEAVDIARRRLLDSGFMVAGAESCTGGLAGKLLTDAGGSSAYMWGSLTTYANSAKQQVLGVSSELLDAYGAVSAECAAAMVEGVRKLSEADVSFSITGIAGPGGGSPEKPVGTVYFGFSAGGGLPDTQVRLSFHAYTRDSVRRRAAVAVCLLLDSYLSGRKLLDIISRWQYS
jgi:nicotinamide-nucleotide amidase